MVEIFCIPCFGTTGFEQTTTKATNHQLPSALFFIKTSRTNVQCITNETYQVDILFNPTFQRLLMSYDGNGKQDNQIFPNNN